jgi:hypothetical protein
MFLNAASNAIRITFIFYLYIFKRSFKITIIRLFLSPNQKGKLRYFCIDWIPITHSADVRQGVASD